MSLYRHLRLYTLLLSSFLWFACNQAPQKTTDLKNTPWSAIAQQARGQTVNFAMWMGDPYINAYMRDYVAGEVKKRYDIELNMISAQGGQIVAAVMTELEAGSTQSAYDMVWINGETFFQLRQIQGLYGPFTQKLPNAELIDFQNPFIGIDFQQPIEGYECPWGNVQMAIIYNSKTVPQPPKTRQELLEWVKANPGRFTWDTQFTGMTLLKGWMIDIAGDPKKLAGPFNAQAYETYAPQLWDYVNQLKPYLWRQGQSFPTGVAQVHQMFANGELDFTLSNNDGEVDNKVFQGLFPATSRAFVPQSGSIQNSHYLGIIAAAPHKAAAMVVINFMISPQAQLHKMDPKVWGDGTVLDTSRLEPEWQQRFQAAATRRYAPARAEIQDKALMELAPEYMIRLYDDFRRHVIEP